MPVQELPEVRLAEPSVDALADLDAHDGGDHRRPPAAAGRGARVREREADPVDEGRSLPGDVAPFEHPAGDRLRPVLPAAHPWIGRPPVLEEDELAAGLQDTCDAPDRLHYSRNRAQREGADHGIDAAVTQRNAPPRDAQEFAVNLRPAPFPLATPNHP